VISFQDNSSRKTGRRYENLAESFLVSAGYEIIERNWQSRHKEIDLIAAKDRTIVFVEVKAVRSDSFGHPVERIDDRKRKNLIAAAEHFLAERNIAGQDIRFDVITFRKGKLEHYRDAFGR